MTKTVNSFNLNYSNNIRSISCKKNDVPFTSENKSVNDSTGLELQNNVNDFGVKVPLSYSKLCEKDLPTGIKAHFYKLSNGQRIVIIPKEGKTLVKSYVNTGSLNEPDNLRGISHYIEHNLFNGSEGLGAGEFFATTDKMGAETNASTNMAETDYYISSNLLNDNDLENKIKLHASMLETPRFAFDMLEKEKGIVNSEINIATASPENIALSHTIKNLFNIKSSSIDLVAGTTNNISNLTREDVVNYFNNNYYPANIVTVVSGEVEPEETIKLLAKNFSSTKTPPSSRHYENLVPIEKTVRQDIISDKTNSAFLMMGFKGPENSDIKKNIYAGTLNEIMFYSSDAENIFKPLNVSPVAFQEKVLAKSNAPVALLIAGETSEENSEIMLRKIYGRIQKYQQQPISDEELNIVKKNMKRSYAHMMESSSGVNAYVGQALQDGGNVDLICDYEKIIDQMTPKDLQDFAKEYFDLNKAAITILHPAKTDEKSIKDNFSKSQSVSFTGTVKKKAYNLDKVKQFKLPNNYNIVTYNSNLPEVYADFRIKTDNEINPKNPAAIAVLNEILEYGTAFKTEEELSKLKEKEGTNITLIATREGLIGSFDCAIENFDSAQSLYRELLENPRFTDENFNEAVNYLRDIITRREKSPMDKLTSEIDEKAYSKEEILEGLRTLTLDDVKQVYSDILSDNRAIASYAAPYSSNPDIKNKIINSAAQFKNVKPYKPVLKDDFEPIKESKVLTDVDNKNQANIVMAYKFKTGANIKDEAALNLMNIIFGGSPTSRLFSDLREKQKLAYRVQSKINCDNTTGRMLIRIGTTTDNKTTGEKSFDNVQKSINGFIDNINKMKNEKITEEELNKAKQTMKNDILSANETTDNKNSILLNSAGGWYGVDGINKLLETIDEITIDDIYNTANNVFAGKPIYSIVASQDTLDFNKDYFRNLIK